jgi:hypothetical protein
MWIVCWERLMLSTERMRLRAYNTAKKLTEKGIPPL